MAASLILPHRCTRWNRKQPRRRSLTENLHIDGGLRVSLLRATDNAFIDASVIDVGVVDGESGGEVIISHH